jgi:hypothetical protein
LRASRRRRWRAAGGTARWWTARGGCSPVAGPSMVSWATATATMHWWAAGMGWGGMGWDGMGWDGMGWDGMGSSQCAAGKQGSREAGKMGRWAKLFAASCMLSWPHRPPALTLTPTPAPLRAQVPREVQGLRGRRIAQVSGGWRHTMAADDSGAVFAWGWNKFGQVRRRLERPGTRPGYGALLHLAAAPLLSPRLTSDPRATPCNLLAAGPGRLRGQAGAHAGDRPAGGRSCCVPRRLSCSARCRRRHGQQPASPPPSRCPAPQPHDRGSTGG